jgi:hypothetical protein
MSPLNVLAATSKALPWWCSTMSPECVFNS